MQEAENILAPRQPVEDALSHTSSQHLKEFRDPDRTACQYRRDHGQVRQNGGVDQGDFVQREALEGQLYVFAGRLLDEQLCRWKSLLVRRLRCLLSRTREQGRGGLLVPADRERTTPRLACFPPTLRCPFRCFFFLRP